jgi:hypothetical protein
VVAHVLLHLDKSTTMKSILLILLIAFSSHNLSAQTTTSKTTTKRSTSKVKSTTPTRQSNNATSATATTPAIDSFKRSNRYSPGRPYEAAPANTTTNNASAAATVNNSTNVNANSRNGLGRVNTDANVNNNGNVMIGSNSQQNIPGSPSHEPNRADINQRPINENSKNAISDMNSGQVNALNQNQMAPPPQNWGNNQSADNKWGRNTIGESQWTPTSTIASSFTRDFPNVSGATWIRDVRDTTIYSARYRTGDYWTTSTYNTSGSRIDTRTELPLTNLPRPVSLYSDKQRANNLQLEQITKIERTAKSIIYEVRLNSGRVVYINSDGVETGL